MLITKDLRASSVEQEAILAPGGEAFGRSSGNLCLRTVSNVGRTRATSHPCERGAGLLENLSNPQEIGAAKFPPFLFEYPSGGEGKTADMRPRLAAKFVEVCDVSRAGKSF
jgi:hypothetical protein